MPQYEHRQRWVNHQNTTTDETEYRNRMNEKGAETRREGMSSEVRKKVERW
jgi:hypothetical protein